MDGNYQHFVGIDWATAEHEVHAMNAEGKRESARSFKHSGDGLADLCAWLLKLGDPATIAVAIEVPHGAVVETLLDRGFVIPASTGGRRGLTFTPRRPPAAET